MRDGRSKVALAFGALGGLAVLCCVTPILPLALTAFGATALLGYVYIDLVLIPFAALMFGLMVLALRRRHDG